MQYDTKGFYFYCEMPSEWNSKSGCKSHQPFTRKTIKESAALGQYRNCVAIAADSLHGHHGPEGFSAIFYRNNSAVNWGGVSRDYLRDRCVRIDAATALKLHPALAARMVSES